MMKSFLFQRLGSIRMSRVSKSNRSRAFRLASDQILIGIKLSIEASRVAIKHQDPTACIAATKAPSHETSPRSRRTDAVGNTPAITADTEDGAPASLRPHSRQHPRSGRDSAVGIAPVSAR